ncbi:hypothetical protein BU14_0713s0002 [Porphyra umbilicalis]|uniref:Uncharacterized protein n=1 Tax=Porphyra umbilicalis TaxID=2786 RepID=A0A1X6NQ01_PORUM|nr:hypothetical protein BU14_0713s0002 [Porphyra umbilicalis]|eukprot:OSX70600.1 hypothetical protein BU14_0713s0002 [Porphyra umbilicalis]
MHSLTTTAPDNHHTLDRISCYTSIAIMPPLLGCTMAATNVLHLPLGEKMGLVGLGPVPPRRLDERVPQPALDGHPAPGSVRAAGVPPLTRQDGASPTERRHQRRRIRVHVRRRPQQRRGGGNDEVTPAATTPLPVGALTAGARGGGRPRQAGKRGTDGWTREPLDEHAERRRLVRRVGPTKRQQRRRRRRVDGRAARRVERDVFRQRCAGRRGGADRPVGHGRHADIRHERVIRTVAGVAVALLAAITPRHGNAVRERVGAEQRRCRPRRGNERAAARRGQTKQPRRRHPPCVVPDRAAARRRARRADNADAVGACEADGLIGRRRHHHHPRPACAVEGGGDGGSSHRHQRRRWRRCSGAVLGRRRCVGRPDAVGDELG